MASFAVRLQRLTSSRWLRIAFLAAGLAFMAVVLRGRWAEVRHYRFLLRPGFLAASAAVLLSAMLLEVALWRRLLGLLGYTLAPKRAAGIWFLSNLVRYVPGNIWQFLGMMELGAASQVPRRVMLAGIILHQGFSNLAGIVIGAYAVVRLGSLPSLSPITAGLAMLFGLAALSPPVVRRGIRLLLRVSGDLPSSGLSYRAALLLGLGYCLYWLVIGTAFWLLARGIGAAPASAALTWVSAFAAAYVIGYLSLLTPSGLGVREGTLALLLTTAAGPGPAAVAAVVARLWLVVGELGATLVAALLDHRLLAGREAK